MASVPARPRRAKLVTTPPLLIGVAILFGALAVACGAGTDVEPQADPEPGGPAEPGVVSTPPAAAESISVALSESSVTPAPATVQSGEVYFLAKNVGGEAHELVVIRSDLPANGLPTEDGRVPEDEVDMIGEISPFSAGSEASAVFELEAGSYVLICNVVEEEEGGEPVSHYEKGMYASLTVE
jgi:uncharacterized cupredoxin-like copper-binding protein